MIICFMASVAQGFYQSIRSKLIGGKHPCGQDAGYIDSF